MFLICFIAPVQVGKLLRFSLPLQRAIHRFATNGAGGYLTAAYRAGGFEVVCYICK